MQTEGGRGKTDGVSRRLALKTLGAAGVAPLLDSRGFHLHVQDLNGGILAAIADVVLPSEADRPAAVTAFTRWIANYKEGADTDHGYGSTRVRGTGPSPARNYPAQIAALDAAARAQGNGGFVAASLGQRRALVLAAIAETKLERLPARPTGAHLAADLMAHYFNSPAAADLCYRAAIGRDTCRGLPGSEKQPAPIAPRAPRSAPRAAHLAPRS